MKSTSTNYTHKANKIILKTNKCKSYKISPTDMLYSVNGRIYFNIKIAYLITFSDKINIEVVNGLLLKSDVL